MYSVRMIIIPKLMFVFIIGIRKAGVGIGNIKYRRNMTKRITSNGETLFIDGNFMTR
jgi:hypothetical protein